MAEATDYFLTEDELRERFEERVLDVLMAILEGVEAAGVSVDIRGCDLTESRMYVRIRANEIMAYALS